MQISSIDRDLEALLHTRFVCDVVDKLKTYVNELVINRHITGCCLYDTTDVNDRIMQLTRIFFGSGNYTEEEYLYALYGAISPHASPLDFIMLIRRRIPEIHNFYEADQGLKDFVGKWVVTRRPHKNAKSDVPEGTIVKITGESTSGYEIEDEFGNPFGNIGFGI